MNTETVKTTVHEELAECEICDRIVRIMTDHGGFYICPECGASMNNAVKREKDAE